MAAAGGSWQNYKKKGGAEYSIFTKEGESKKQAVARKRKEGYSI